MKERRNMGLCYYCDSKWNPQQNYKIPKLFLLEGTKEIWEQEEANQEIENMLEGKESL